MKLNQIISEASLPLWEFSYPEYENDPTPKVIVLGSYIHPETGNNLLMGINVRLLNTQKALQLVSMINDISRIKDGRIRVKYLRTRASRIFNEAYRTYDLSKVEILEKTTISSKGPSQSKKQVINPVPAKTEKPENTAIPKDTSVPDVEKDLAQGPTTDKGQTTGQDTNKGQTKLNVKKNVTLPKPEKLQPTGVEDPLSYNQTSVTPTSKRVDKKSTGEQNVGNSEKISPETKRGSRRLDKMSKGSEEEVRQSNSTIPDLENEEY